MNSYLRVDVKVPGVDKERGCKLVIDKALFCGKVSLDEE